VGLIKKLKQQIDEAFSEEHRSPEKQTRLQKLMMELRTAKENAERKRKKKKLDAAKAVVAAAAEEAERKEKEKTKKPSEFAYVGVIGGSGPVKIDASLHSAVKTFEPFTQHITADGIEVPVSVTLHEGKKVILPLPNIVLGVGPTATVAQIGGDKEDFTVKNLTVTALRQVPEEVPVPLEYRATQQARYAALRTKKV
jgi:hypothetical protein